MGILSCKVIVHPTFHEDQRKKKSQCVPSLAKEGGPMGGAPYIRLKQGGGPTFKVSILCTTMHCCPSPSNRLYCDH